MLLRENYLYFIPVALQAICALHCLRKGNQNKWLWIIVFLPLIGSLIYIYSEILTGREAQQVKSGLGSLFNPAGGIKQLEAKVKFADTFTNKVQLADAYLATGQTERAVDIYEGCLTGVFAENEHVLLQLIEAYGRLQAWPELITATRKIYTRPQFARSRQHMLYAQALDAAGDPAAAETEFKKMTARFSNFEQRYQYGQFLFRHQRGDEAARIYQSMVDEAAQLSPRERSAYRQWINQAKDSLRTLPA
ncbi:PLDc N-terminal domain-containing protein [Flavihumibacter petaseus]|uniref:Cardiolipin synthase N-terminal domain-containing protein n=1 Tax=Flavihumibacter petaseus NBRC 106054 TaxID=1220578 RepID=A0A0E9N0Q3_9BACT|nr:PLDc N-terminal domain-containing protein [Flavihumibacter petaseus]GAO43587.1 hypothetical protein FPE01S_02_06930 [Flavihumibacter petaseus NBRC 106054]